LFYSLQLSKSNFGIGSAKLGEKIFVRTGAYEWELIFEKTVIGGREFLKLFHAVPRSI
jgi:hypothetical protein